MMLLIAANHLPILGPDSPVSSSNVPNWPALPSGLSRIPKRTPILSSGPATAALKGLVAILPALPALKCLLKDGPLLTVSFPFARSIDGVKVSSVPLTALPSSSPRRSCQWELSHISCSSLFLKCVLRPLDVVVLLVPLALCEVDEVKEAILRCLLIDRKTEPAHPCNIGVGSPSLSKDQQPVPQTAAM